MSADHQVLEWTPAPAVGDICHMENNTFPPVMDGGWNDPVPMKEEHVAGIYLTETINAEFLWRVDEHPCSRQFPNPLIKQQTVPRLGTCDKITRGRFWPG